MTTDQIVSLVGFFFCLGGVIGWYIGHHRYAYMHDCYRRSLDLRMRTSADARVVAENTAAYRTEVNTRIQRMVDQLKNPSQQIK